MSPRLWLPLIVVALACASENTAPSGTFVRAQKDYLKALEQCQEKYLWDISADGGAGAAQTKDDAEFSACLAPAKTTLEQQMRQAQSLDAGPREGS